MKDEAMSPIPRRGRRGRVPSAFLHTIVLLLYTWDPSTTVAPLGRDAPLELLGVGGLGDRVFLADVTVDEELLDRAVERLHAQGAAGLDDVGDFENAVLADAVPHGGCAEHDLDGRDHPRLVGALEER